MSSSAKPWSAHESAYVDDGVEIGGGTGLHYHYGTLGQLEHGVNYADAYLRTIGKKTTPPSMATAAT